MKTKLKLLLMYIIIIAVTFSMVLFVVEFANLNKNNIEINKLYSKINTNGFQVLKNDKWKSFFVKGVNIGAALPGKWFTEFPRDEKTYYDWLEKIGQMNANCIRIYTLLPPEFYSALLRYNIKNSQNPLYLLQEIWPEENPKEENYLEKAYVNEYFLEIERDIDAIHGNKIILERKGRAFGVYRSDVSKYILGYLVGRELEPNEVISTDEKNEGYKFSGQFLSSGIKASPTEGWLAMNCDYVLKYEESNYKQQHPVAIVSWPTLDPKEHDSEWNISESKSREYNDKASVDINNIDTEIKMKAGFFGAYHIYPNYPDFMNNENIYNNYRDEQGRLRYGGYLKEFISGHTKYPALVAEFGLATGMGNAHVSPDGLNHGGMTEKQQGDGIVRMIKAIKKEGYAGGIIFEWMDEWAKKTWITQPFMVPYDRHAFWHNAMDPEQNYGILAMESKEFGKTGYLKLGTGEINVFSVKHDATFIYLNISFNKVFDFNKQKLMVGLDTFGRKRGEYKFDKNIDVKSPYGLEFLLDINGKNNSRILVRSADNIAKYQDALFENYSGVFKEINQCISPQRITKDGKIIKSVYYNQSKLKHGAFTNNSKNQINIENGIVHIRLPWALLNFTDPSSMTVFNDTRSVIDFEKEVVNTTKSDGIEFSVLLYDKLKKKKVDLLNSDMPYKWDVWNEPIYNERFKESYYIVADYFEKLK